MTKADPVRDRARRPRILLGPVEIAGYYAGLEAALREVGVDALAIDLEGNPFRYGAGSNDPAVVRLAQRVGARRQEPKTNPLLRQAWHAAWLASRVALLIWSIFRFDVFVFSFGRTLLRKHELSLLRRLGKRVIFVFHGSDARPPYIDGFRMAPDRALPIPECVAVTRRMKATIRRIERFSDVVVAQPAFSHFFERPVVNFFVLGVPWRDQPMRAGGPRMGDGPIRILHAPSDPTIKGSARIREVVGDLQSEGLALDLISLRGLPNEVVLRELADCDFAIDQIYSDAPMVGFATEAAVAGKPTIVGGYAWSENHRVFGSVPMPPVEECAPEALSDAVRRLATDAERRASLGREAQAFVRSAWSRQEMAQRFLRLVEGAPPLEWMFDPRELRYVEGCGLTRDQARDIVAAVLREGGRQALCLADKPELEARFQAFATERPLDSG